MKHALADVTRDGRDDVVLLIDGSQRTRIELLRPRAGTRKLTRSVAWRSGANAKLPFAKLKLAMSDVDTDGLWDVVLYRDAGADGLAIETWRTRSTDPYGKLTPGPAVADPDIDWSAIRPY